MTQRWDEIERLLGAALRLPKDERERFLRERCGSDEELLHQSLGFLRETTTYSGAPPSPPRRIGPYRIIEKIGEGGMGVVYSAEQREPIRRRVAIKIIKLGTDTEVLARFEVEHRALSLLDHPHIARLLDAGSTDDGRPYFVMEYVPGIALNEYADRHRLPPRDRLKLCIPICQAVDHAHRRGIIHRDLKPSNILVMLQDGEPVPKIIDFGVAKATAQRLTEQAYFTLIGQIIGTPEYMSPEQAEMSGIDIDGRTDVYSLGVILYELLVGALPFDSVRLRQAGYAEIQRILREEDPPRPSTRVERPGADSELAAQRRGTSRRTLVRRLRGDLDWIIMKCLEKDRTRRYADAEGLAEDLRRHLSDQPVLAGPPGPLYRARKFLRRHLGATTGPAERRRLAATLFVGVALAAAVLYGLWARSDDSGGVRRPTWQGALVGTAGLERNSRIAPDRRRVSYVSNASGISRVLLTTVDGDEHRPVTPGSVAVFSHCWAPDGDSIASVVDDGGRFRLEVSEVAATGSTRVVCELAERRVHLLRWLGDRIYFADGEALRRVEVGSGRVEVLLRLDEADIVIRDLDVRPDERRIAYVALDDAGSGLWHATLDGSDARCLVRGSFVCRTPHWVGNDQILFLSDQGGRFDPWSVGLDGAPPRPRLVGTEVSRLEDVSDDGLMLVFREDHDQANLWRLDPDGSAPPRRLTEDRLEDFWPSCAVDPDGTVVFQRSRPDRGPFHWHAELMVGSWASSSTSGSEVVRALKLDGFAPLLSPRAGWLAYLAAPQDPQSWPHLCVSPMVGPRARSGLARFQDSGYFPFPRDSLGNNAIWLGDCPDLLFVAVDDEEGSELRRYCPRTAEMETLIEGAEKHRLSDLTSSSGGRALAFLEWHRSGELENFGVHVVGLARDERGHVTLGSGEEIWRTSQSHRGLHCRGWTDDDSHLVLVRGEPRDMVELLRVPVSGGATVAATELGRGFASSARYDSKRSRLYLTLLDDDGIHDIHCHELDSAVVRPITRNQLRENTFCGIQVLADGTLIYTQQGKNPDVWLARFD